MYFDENKKVLFVIGMDQELRPLLQEVTNINPENMLMLQVSGPEISHPYDDLMRAVILAVYEEKVGGIFVVGTTDEPQRDWQPTLYEKEGMEEKVKAIDFLFKHCKPELPGVFHGWLEGSETSIEGIQKTVKFLQDHPLIPSEFRISGLLIDKENGELSEVVVS